MTAPSDKELKELERTAGDAGDTLVARLARELRSSRKVARAARKWESVDDRLRAGFKAYDKARNGKVST